MFVIFGSVPENFPFGTDTYVGGKTVQTFKCKTPDLLDVYDADLRHLPEK